MQTFHRKIISRKHEKALQRTFNATPGRIRQRLYSLIKSSQFIKCEDSIHLGRTVHRILCDIMAIGAHQKHVALRLLHIFLNAYDPVIKRTDDAYNYVASPFKNGLKCLGLLYQMFPHEIAIQEVWQRFHANTFGIHTYMIEYFQSALGEPGLHEIAHRLRNMKKDADHNASDKEYFRIFCLQQIAIALHDIDSYIAACSRDIIRTILEDFYIARNLFTFDRPTEALIWIAHAESQVKPHNCWELSGYSSLSRLKIQVLSTLQRHTEAQEERKHYFKNSLRITAYHELLEHAPQSEHIALRDFAISCAYAAYTDPHDQQSLHHTALEFLLDLNAYSDAAIIVRNYRTFLKPYVLHDFATQLVDQYPLEATLLYRQLIDAIFRCNTGVSTISSYHRPSVYRTEYARNNPSQEILLCKELAQRIVDWKEYPNHQAYMAQLKITYAWRKAFWRKNGCGVE